MFIPFVNDFLISVKPFLHRQFDPGGFGFINIVLQCLYAALDLARVDVHDFGQLRVNLHQPLEDLDFLRGRIIGSVNRSGQFVEAPDHAVRYAHLPKALTVRAVQQ